MTVKCESIGKYISMLHRMGSCYYNKKLSPYNIGSGQIMFLAYLYAHDGVNQEDMSHNLNIDKGTTARAIKKLEEEGYIIRKVDDKDKRAYRIYVTDKALAIKEEFYEVLKSWNDIISSDFTDEEKEMVIKLLNRMVNNRNNFYMKGENLCNMTDKKV